MPTLWRQLGTTIISKSCDLGGEFSFFYISCHEAKKIDRKGERTRQERELRELTCKNCNVDSKQIQNRFKSDSKQIQNGFKTDSKQIQNRFKTDSKQIQNGFKTDSNRFKTDSNQIQTGFKKDSKRILV